MSQPSVLIVEDENIVALDIQSRVESLGYTVAAVVRSGERAIEELDAFAHTVAHDLKNPVGVARRAKSAGVAGPPALRLERA